MVFDFLLSYGLNKKSNSHCVEIYLNASRKGNEKVLKCF